MHTPRTRKQRDHVEVSQVWAVERRRQCREAHGRNLSPHRQHENESSGSVEWRRRYAVSCANTMPNDPELDASLSMPRRQSQL